MDSNGFKQCAGTLGKIGGFLLNIPDNIQASVREIRLRLGRPLMLSTENGELFVSPSGVTSGIYTRGIYIIDEKDMDECFHSICDYSIHSHADDIRQGFVTIRGGHRAGICGTAVITGGKLSGIRNIGSINLRIASQVYGAANEMMRLFENNDTGVISNTLIAGAPSSGKTTLLKDIIRQLTNGYKKKHIKTAVVDSRGELGSVYNGIPQNDLGPCADILDGYPKPEGMEIAIRTLSPDIIVCDEIGGISDLTAAVNCINSGVNIIATIHASNEKEVMEKEGLANLINNGIFKNIVILEGAKSPCKIRKMFSTCPWTEIKLCRH